MGIRTQRGFTMVEIMIAVVITSIGFAAIFSLQIASIQGNVAAREMGAAVNLAERYAEELRRDTHLWLREGGGAEPNFIDPDDAEEWRSFTSDPVDHNGRPFVDDDDDGTELARQRFCVHYWLQPLTGSYKGLYHARVRVVWPRAALDQTGLDEVCSAPAEFQDNVQSWFTITVPVTLRQQPEGVPG